jgi:K+-transporting ATPase ATPase A chain
MTLASAAQDAHFLAVVILLVKPVGGYLYRVFSHQKTFLDPLFKPVERLLYRLAGVEATQKMSGR